MTQQMLSGYRLRIDTYRKLWQLLEDKLWLPSLGGPMASPQYGEYHHGMIREVSYSLESSVQSDAKKQVACSQKQRSH